MTLHNLLRIYRIRQMRRKWRAKKEVRLYFHEIVKSTTAITTKPNYYWLQWLFDYRGITESSRATL